MLTQKTQNSQLTANKNIVLEAELDSSNLIPEEYDHQQIESGIKFKDYQIELLHCSGQTSVLVGIQIVSTQFLLSIGSVGLYPVCTALFPVFGSVVTTLTNFNFNDGVSLEDKTKLPGQILRSTALAGNATKLILDAKAMDDIASKSFEVVVKQERLYRNLPEPQKLDLMLPGILFLLVVIAAVVKRKN
ncbi:hypothetical protein [Cuspidothrix issatschenkoi]|uniref:Uncharacterized protein n=1 Tax=Cuspidothrix issatschenkoi CHARLIE-1 TaxID=2052836 RepID=A0A2S6CZW1_9CYAN|nr:hypothetical protein [Cuspidothrix issatschenkoi]PPJ65262.1 hypothetical protein CUN59_00405 [Cuspidothrix issatschenkoi CHARLIE-1]